MVVGSFERSALVLGRSNDPGTAHLDFVADYGCFILDVAASEDGTHSENESSPPPEKC